MHAREAEQYLVAPTLSAKRNDRPHQHDVAERGIVRPEAECLENRSSWLLVNAPAVRPMVDSGQIQMGNIRTDQQARHCGRLAAASANLAGLVVVSSAATVRNQS